MAKARRDLRQARIFVRDGSTYEIEVEIGTGNLTWTEQTPLEYEPERGNIANGTVRYADQVPVEVNIVAKWVDVTSHGAGGEAITITELLKRIGNAADAVSVGSACEPYAAELEITFLPICTGGGEPARAERIVFSEFRQENCQFDPQAGTITIAGKSKEASATYDRPAPPANSVAPEITGTVEIGQTLTVSDGTWDSGVLVERQWYRNQDGGDAELDIGNVPIEGATDATYTVAAEDDGYVLIVRITYESPYGRTSVLSNITTIV